MLLIISAFIELILCFLIFVYIPKKSHFETEYLVKQYNKNYQMYHHSYYNSSYCDYFVENLKTSKEMSMLIFCLSILLLLFVFSRIIAAIYNKCKDNANSAIKFIRASTIIGFIIILGNIALLGLIIYKIFKLVKDTQDEFDVTRSLSLNCTYACLIFIAILISNIIQMCVSFKKYTIKDTHTQSNYTPNGNVKVIPTKPITINNIGYEENIATTSLI